MDFLRESVFPARTKLPVRPGNKEDTAGDSSTAATGEAPILGLEYPVVPNRFPRWA